MSSSRRLALTLDVPSAATGTGSALVLDGRDVAMLRCAVVDGAALIADATDRIAWRVVSGPGRLAGVASGDPTSHEWMKSDAIDVYGGLARAFVKVTEDCTSEGRELVAAVDADAARGPTRIAPSTCDTSPIVVEASAAGLPAVRVSIRVSADEGVDGALAVAARTARSFVDGFSYLDSFVG